MSNNKVAPAVSSPGLPNEPWLDQGWAALFTFGPFVACALVFLLGQACQCRWQRRRERRDLTMELMPGGWKLTGNPVAMGRFLGAKSQKDLFKQMDDMEAGRVRVDPSPTSEPPMASGALGLTPEDHSGDSFLTALEGSASRAKTE